MSDFARALLAPSSIALVGASDDAQKASSRPLPFLRNSGYAGAIYPVNSRRDTVGGERAYNCLLELPEVPDHVLLMTPTSGVIDAVADCGRLGVPVVTVLSGGFAEDGPAGVARQHELLATAASGGVRLLGPNSLGVVNLNNGLRLTGNAVFADPDLPAGGTFVASQSGSLIGALVSRGQAKGLGFASVVSVGGEADLSIGEICATSLDDDQVTGYLLFLETIRHAGALADFAAAAGARGKPVVAYKLGRSPVAAQLALSHTGALAGEEDVADAFLAACGIARVHSLDGLLEAQPFTRRLPIRTVGQPPVSVAVVTTTGGGAAMVVDQLGLRGVKVTPATTHTHDRLAVAGVSVAPGPILDLTLAGARYEIMKAALDVLLDAPEFDVVLAVVGSSARSRPDLAVAPIIDSAGSKRPLVAFLVPDAPEAATALAAAGVPTFTSPETCADVMAATVARRPPHARPGPSAHKPGPSAHKPGPSAHKPGPPAVVDGGELLDEAAAYRVLAEAGVPATASAELEVPLPDRVRLPFGYPVAVKVLAPKLAHKTDVGGVVLGVRDATELATAVAQIAADLQRHLPDQQLRRVLVQPMTSGVGEVLVGFRLDAQVGPVVLVSAGGVAAELYRDRSVRLAPVDAATAREMLAEVTAVELLRGYRGAPHGDLDALVDAVVALSELAADERILEAEVNPLVVQAQGAGVLAVDALVRMRE